MDIIWARPLEVKDQCTAVVAVTHEDVRNDYDYDDQEQVRIRAVKPSANTTVHGFATMDEFARVLMGNRVRLHVHEVDDDGRLVADAWLITGSQRGRWNGRWVQRAQGQIAN